MHKKSRNLCILTKMKKIKKFFQKPIDIFHPVWYYILRKNEGGTKKMMSTELNFDWDITSEEVYGDSYEGTYDSHEGEWEEF